MANNILIVDDHPFLRMGVITFLEKNFNNIFCVETDSVTSTEESLKKTNFNFAFVDISLGGEDGLKLAGFIKTMQSACKVIVLSMHKEPLLVQKAQSLGLDGYLIKEDAFDSFKNIISFPSNTDFIISDKLLDAISSSGKSEFTKTLVSKYNGLTQREQTIFRLLAEGSNYKEIAVELGIKQKTVLVHRYNLLKKMELNDQTELVKCAIKLGLIDSF